MPHQKHILFVPLSVVLLLNITQGYSMQMLQQADLLKAFTQIYSANYKNNKL